MQTDDHLEQFKKFIKENGNSENVQAMYYKRVRTFLAARPEARGELMTLSQVGNAFGLISEKAGLRNPGTHSLRRSVASAMVNGYIRQLVMRCRLIGISVD